MNIEFLSRLGDGAFADVYVCKDTDLDRKVAIKFIRGGSEAISSALDHARALARTSHPNVVTIYSLGKAENPVTHEETDCVVMELVKGVTLEERLKGPRLGIKELTSLGLQMIDGLKHIHDQGLVHGDFHVENLMVSDQGIKIIDILYRGTLAALPAVARDRKIAADLIRLRMHLVDLLMHSELDAGEASGFNQSLHGAANIGQIRDSFLHFTDETVTQNLKRLVEHAYHRVTVDHFVKGKDYASALSDETGQRVIAPLLTKLIASRAYLPKHSNYVRILWGRLSEGDQAEVIKILNDRLQQDIPNGRWWPNLRVLALLHRKIWGRLSPALWIKLESLIVNDVLSGRHDIYSKKNDSGSLGTYVISLHAHFQDKEKLVSNIEAMLSQSWYTQNYVGTHFLKILHLIASTPDHRSRLIAGLRIAIRNDARIIKNNLNDLPDSWVADIRKREKPAEELDEEPEYS